MSGGRQCALKEDVARSRSRILHGYVYAHESAIRLCYGGAADQSANGEGADQASRTGGFFDQGELQ